MAGKKSGSFAQPDEVREFELGKTEIVDLGDYVVGRQSIEPGWRWSEHVKPAAGTDWCDVRHVGYVMSGRMTFRLHDGSLIDTNAGDVFDVPAQHDSWVVGDEPWVAIKWTGIRSFGGDLAHPGQRVLTTILFTDIVDSTATATLLGDARWRAVLSEQREQMRDAMDRFRGREIDTAGDGFVATFDGAARAVQCAVWAVEQARQLDLDLRAGVHTGEVEMNGTDVRGIAVHLAARVMSIAGAGEVLVSATTRELLDGSGIDVDDRGMHEFKGVSGARQVFAVR